MNRCCIEDNLEFVGSEVLPPFLVRGWIPLAWRRHTSSTGATSSHGMSYRIHRMVDVILSQIS